MSIISLSKIDWTITDVIQSNEIHLNMPKLIFFFFYQIMIITTIIVILDIYYRTAITQR